MSPVAITETFDHPVKLTSWVEPPETKEDCKPHSKSLWLISVQWADLETIDLRLLDSKDPEVRTKLVASAKKALTVDGFLFVTGTGVTDETLRRNLAIAQYAISGISREEKIPFAAKLDEGSYRGYKLRGIWKKEGGVPDNLEVGDTSM